MGASVADRVKAALLGTEGLGRHAVEMQVAVEALRCLLAEAAQTLELCDAASIMPRPLPAPADPFKVEKDDTKPAIDSIAAGTDVSRPLHRISQGSAATARRRGEGEADTLVALLEARERPQSAGTRRARLSAPLVQPVADQCLSDADCPTRSQHEMAMQRLQSVGLRGFRMSAPLLRTSVDECSGDIAYPRRFPEEGVHVQPLSLVSQSSADTARRRGEDAADALLLHAERRSSVDEGARLSDVDSSSASVPAYVGDRIRRMSAPFLRPAVDERFSCTGLASQSAETEARNQLQGDRSLEAWKPAPVVEPAWTPATFVGPCVGSVFNLSGGTDEKTQDIGIQGARMSALLLQAVAEGRSNDTAHALCSPNAEAQDLGVSSGRSAAPVCRPATDAVSPSGARLVTLLRPDFSVQEISTSCDGKARDSDDLAARRPQAEAVSSRAALRQELEASVASRSRSQPPPNPAVAHFHAESPTWARAPHLEHVSAQCSTSPQQEFAAQDSGVVPRGTAHQIRSSDGDTRDLNSGLGPIPSQVCRPEAEIFAELPPVPVSARRPEDSDEFWQDPTAFGVGTDHQIHVHDEGAQDADVGSGCFSLPVQQPDARVVSQPLERDGALSFLLTPGAAVYEGRLSVFSFGPSSGGPAVDEGNPSEFSFATAPLDAVRGGSQQDAQVFSDHCKRDPVCSCDEGARVFNVGLGGVPLPSCVPEAEFASPILAQVGEQDSTPLRQSLSMLDISGIPLPSCEPEAEFAVPILEQGSEPYSTPLRQSMSMPDISTSSGRTQRYSICSSDEGDHGLDVGLRCARPPACPQEISSAAPVAGQVSARLANVLRPEVSAHLSRLSQLTTRLSTNEHMSRMSINGSQAKTRVIP